MRVLILGGDGYLGWPTAMYLSSQGNEVCVVDNYFRRFACVEKDVPSLFDTPNLFERARHWQEVSGKEIMVRIGSVADYPFLLDVFHEFKPDAVVHYAEQPSAPYSMLGHSEARFTLENNLLSTLNVAYAVKETDPSIHIVKLGTMGEYGTPNIDIEEGFIDIEHKGRKDRLLFPRQAGSLYHTTKIQDTDLLYFYVRVWGLRVTDLMQGPVYGIFTEEMGGDEDLFTVFNYDEIFGTVLNRFIVQAVAGVPLTVYGKGGQTRGYLNIKDTLQCVGLAIAHPARKGEMKIYNQFTETFSVNDLANAVQRAGKDVGIDVEIKSVPNPRVELEDHYYNPVHTGLLDLGLEPTLLTNNIVAKMLESVIRRKDEIRRDIIQPKTQWN
ncbi:NAD-dependent epimerase/dehydratase family protein [Thiohalobacter sp. IOR34]|uniref:NAD-dependent epimerase/dehydratase family protein n=1 Tax=Thiohalobacter sp. IOR34 TaxID=3057176 RepID=UPI0025B1CC3D|nr:NAD-dependent epimerase/dehydratase family protein [Thiohalobacter sp. IOR34]WJW76699.1 NAD-dependent epimerase/dehydratase family protein [Thiohalobacter sp. IOR34]